MPTYEYICLNCEHAFENFQSMSSEPLSVCPECSGELKRKIGAGLSPIFKGSGFYQTDYKPQKKDSTAPKADDSKKPAPPPAPSGTADTKPAASSKE